MLGASSHYIKWGRTCSSIMRFCRCCWWFAGHHVAMIGMTAATAAADAHLPTYAVFNLQVGPLQAQLPV